MNASTADFAATAPWKGITGKPDSFPSAPSSLSPDGASDRALLLFSASQGKWLPVTPAAAMSILQQFLRLTPDDVGLGNVDNTSDAQKNEAVATLTNKTILGAYIRGTLQFGILSPSGFNLFLTTESLISADRTLSLLLSDDADHTIDLSGDLTIVGGNLVVSLSDGTGSGEDRLFALDGDLTIHCFGAARTFNLVGNLTLGADFTTTHAIAFVGEAAVFTLTGATAVTFPTSGTLATTAQVAAAQAAAIDDADATKQPLTGNSFAVAGLPSAAANVGRMVYCTNGNAGSPCGALSDGTNWKVVALGATVSP